jgi:hypothetical protein
MIVENQHHSFSISVVFNAQPRSGGAGRSSKIHCIKGAGRQKARRDSVDLACGDSYRHGWDSGETRGAKGVMR